MIKKLSELNQKVVFCIFDYFILFHEGFVMEILLIRHARERMIKYELTEEEIMACLNCPDLIITGRENRRIAQKRLNGYVLRVIYEKVGNTFIVITTYKAKRDRYEI